jgi:hypothetical protein
MMKGDEGRDMIVNPNDEESWEEWEAHAVGSAETGDTHVDGD